MGLSGLIRKRDTRIINDSEWKGMIIATLNVVIGLRKDHDELKDWHNQNSERIGRREESTKAAHRRIDAIETKSK